MEITMGMKGKSSTLVERQNTAKEMGSGSLLVYATPSMVALMEAAACNAIAEALPEGQTSVGTEMHVSHIAATPVGMEVHAEAEVVAVDGRLITYKIEAFDESGKIGEASHKRALILTERFLDKTYVKL